MIAPQEAEDNFVLAVPEQFNHKKADGDYIFFDHSGLIREYKSRMFYNHARYAALRKDYAELEAKFSTLSASSTSFSNLKKAYMKNRNDQLLTNETDRLPTDQFIQHTELADKLEQLSKSYQRLEEENRFLQEQVSLQSSGDEEKDKIVNRWKEEHETLREKVSGQEYLEELLEEKNAQISFLQNQLESRIKNQHLAEQQRQHAIAEKEEQERIQQEFFRETENLKNALLLKQDHADKLQMIVCEKETQLNEGQLVLGSKSDQVTYLENVLQETREKNELLNAELADRKDEVMALQDLLSDERSRLQYTEQKLAHNKLILQKLHKEFSACIQEEEVASPVVTLRPSYISKANPEEWDETAVH